MLATVTVHCNHRVSWIRVYSYGPHNRRLTRANVRDALIPRSASQHGGAARMQIRFPLFVPIELLTSALCLTFLCPYLLRVARIAISLKWDMLRLPSKIYKTSSYVDSAISGLAIDTPELPL